MSDPFAPLKRSLRDYQLVDTDAVRAAWRRGVARPALVWATGLGKSLPIVVLAVEEARAGGRVLIMAHRGELLTQLRNHVRAYDRHIEIGRVQAQQREHDAPIVTATVQTAARLVRDGDPRLRRPTLVIVDEAHHAAARTYERIMRWAGCYDDPGEAGAPPTRALGVTATMDRAEKRGLGLGDVWQEVVAERGIVWGIEHGPDPEDPWHTLPVGDREGYAPRGWLVPLQGLTVVGEHVDLTRAKISRTTGDYADADLGEMVAQDAPEIVKAWYEHAALPDGSHRQTAVFVPTIDAAHAYAESFRGAGIAAELVTGTTPADDRGDVYARTGIYGRVADGRTQVLVSVGVLTEGWDCPPISCIVVARPTQLDHLYQQMVGRGTRPMDPADWPRHDGTPFAPKDDCLVFDVVGMAAHASLRTLVKLVPGAPYVGRPCDVCGRPRPCECPPRPRTDDTGLRTDSRRRLIGPADYAPIDLLADARESGLNWLRTVPQNGYEGIPFLRAGRYYAILWHDEDGTWSGGWVTAKGARDGDWVISSVTFDDALDAVEGLELLDHDDWVPLTELAERRDQPWRLARKSASRSQQSFAVNLGIPDPHTLTAGACSDEIERVLATRRLVDTF